ncbi:unnamed protein product [Rotaria sp. Silwood2]|nr:unnamed protein product [Rotaria sp. Silwood2]
MSSVFILLVLFIIIYIFGYLIYKSYFYFPPIENKQLKNKRVIITGASRGIGEELAYEYARYNCRLILAARSIDILKNQVAKKCLSLGATQVECIQFDASNEQACIELIQKTIEYYEGIDILVLNHTAALYEPFFKSDIKTNIENMKKIFDVNFFGYFQTTMAALPHLVQNGTYEQPSQIIAVSSLTGTCPFPQTTIYAILGLIATESALSATDTGLHLLAADVRKTVQAIIAAGVHGQTRLFYPYYIAIIPPLYYIFSPVYELVARLGN